MATGISSAANFARDSTKRGSISDGDARLMESPIPIANLFLEHYSIGAQSNLSLENVDEIIQEISQSNSAKEIQVSAPHLLRQKWAASHRIGVLQLLAAVRDAL